MKKNLGKRGAGWMLAMVLAASHVAVVGAETVDISNLASEPKREIVLTMGADLNEEQRNNVIHYFGMDPAAVKEIRITNEDERAMLLNLVPEEKIGTHTLSCSLVNPTNAGGIQVKTANMNYVTSNMIAGTLTTSGVYNCEVLTAAPFEVSGTGALTGVMMAYEEASHEPLDATKKELANVELVTTGSIAEEVGQDEATLMVNDIKLRIVRDDLNEEQEVYDTVDDVIAITESAAETAAINQGKEAPKKLGEVQHEQLYSFSYQFSQQEYDYAKIQPTLERVTYNVATSSGIDDPITDTFTTITEDYELPSNSILRGTNDEVWGEDAIINATNKTAVSERPADPIQVFTGEVSLTPVCGVKADEFISGTNIMIYKDLNGSYALMDLNGNLLTDSKYDRYFSTRYGKIIATLNDGSGTQGLLAPDGSILIDFKYPVVKVLDKMWAYGCTLKEGTAENYDYYTGSNYYLADTIDLYYVGPDRNAFVGSLNRSQCVDYCCLSDYINIQDENGVITTYDSYFNALQTTDSLYNFGVYNADKSLEEQLENKTGLSLSSFYGDYVQFYGDNGRGIMDRYGNIIIPAEFESFDTSNDRYEAGGYFCSSGGAETKFVTAGGNVTASYPYGYEDPAVKSIISYGMSAILRGSDDGVKLLSADGIETDLGTRYSYVQGSRESEGMLWCCEADNRYDLVDWHGNVLISGTKSLSLSANGSYLISGDGYTSSMLYRVNDAEEVKIEGTVGAAQEMVIETQEAGSLEVYEGEVRITEKDPIIGEGFVNYTDLIYASEDGTHYALFDVTGQQLTESLFNRYMNYSKGWLIAENADTGKKGILSAENGMQVLPSEYDEVKILDEKWIAAYMLKPAGEDDYDFEDYSDNTYYQIDTAKVLYINGTDVSSVELTRDQIRDISANGDYLNVEDRSSGVVNTYDSTFTAVASASYISDFGDYSMDSVRIKQLEDKTGYYIYTIKDGYAKVTDHDMEKYGIVDLEGNLILPIEYDNIEMAYVKDDIQYTAGGYFAVEKDGKYGFVNADGEVSCDFKYEKEDDGYFYNYGAAAVIKRADGTYLIVSGDGVESGPFVNSPRAEASGKLFVVSDENYNASLIDWHGNVLLNDFRNVSFSANGDYLLVCTDYSSPYVLYTVDDADVIGVQ